MIRAKIITDYNVRSGAVASKKLPGVVYIDPRLPKHFWPFLVIHELEERQQMVGLGRKYDDAHAIATRAERAAVERAGQKWGTYTHAMDGYLAKIENSPVKKPPPDPHIDPDEAVGHHRMRNKR